MLKHTYLAVAVVVLGLAALLVAPGAEAQAGGSGEKDGADLDRAHGHRFRSLSGEIATLGR